MAETDKTLEDETEGSEDKQGLLNQNTTPETGERFKKLRVKHLIAS